MNLDEFIKRYNIEKTMYEAWGNFVYNEIIAEIPRKLAYPHTTKSFLKVPVEPRLKSLDSIIAKAFYRGKNYNDPYGEITDKVGIRFVVLLINDIELISRIIEECKSWSYSLDRNFEKERLASPTTFDYQSKHYVVTSLSKFEYKTTSIDEGITCEIQIRTLLQHAYCELTHDTTYKPKTSIEPEIHRVIARSMALIETADDIFMTVRNKVKISAGKIEDILKMLEKIYIQKCCTTEISYNENIFLLDSMKDIVNEINETLMNSFINEFTFICDKINQRQATNYLFSQPVILALYYLAKRNPSSLKKIWPLNPSILQIIFRDLGISYESE